MMKRIITTMAVAIGVSLIAAATVQACDSCNTRVKETAVKVTPQTTCPVMGGKINKAQYADAKGKRIYVCCPGCIGKIKADPDKYIKQLEKQGVTLDTIPKKVKADKKDK